MSKGPKPFDGFKSKLLSCAALKSQEYEAKRAEADTRMIERYQRAMRFMHEGDGHAVRNKE